MLMSTASKTPAGKRMQDSSVACASMFRSNEARSNDPADRKRNQSGREIPLLERMKVVKNREHSKCQTHSKPKILFPE